MILVQVPALGVSLNEDNVKLDRELLAHGASNLLAGFAGTVPNYLCYVNSVLVRLWLPNRSVSCLVHLS